jgi:hypothetical protein
MELHPNLSARDAHARLVIQLCEALSAFVAATAVEDESVQEPPANDDCRPQHAPLGFHDVISLRGILAEFGLNQPQVMKLRKRCGFPAPIGRARPLMFLRDEVERWVRAQPNRNKLALVLRSRRGISR